MYLIPRNISKRFEFFPGFGWMELLITLIAAVVGLGISFLLGLIMLHPGRFLISLFTTGVGYMAGKPIMPDGSTALDMILHMKNFASSQKLYLFERRQQ